MPGAATTSFGGMRESPRQSNKDFGIHIIASSMEVTSPHPFLMVELTWEQIVARVYAFMDSRDVPLGGTGMQNCKTGFHRIIPLIEKQFFSAEWHKSLRQRTTNLSGKIPQISPMKYRKSLRSDTIPKRKESA